MEKLEVVHKRLFDAAYYAAEAIKKAIDLNVLPKKPERRNVAGPE